VHYSIPTLTYCTCTYDRRTHRRRLYFRIYVYSCTRSCTRVHVHVHNNIFVLSYFRTCTVINKVRRLACFVSLKSVCELSSPRILSLSYLSRSLLLFSTRTRTVHLCVHYVVPTRTTQNNNFMHVYGCTTVVRVRVVYIQYVYVYT
jgi:hypothetical protein